MAINHRRETRERITPHQPQDRITETAQEEEAGITVAADPLAAEQVAAETAQVAADQVAITGPEMAIMMAKRPQLQGQTLKT